MPRSLQELRDAAKLAVMRFGNAYEVDAPDNRLKFAKDLRRKVDDAVDDGGSGSDNAGSAGGSAAGASPRVR